MKSKPILFTIILVLAAFLAGCNNTREATSDEKSDQKQLTVFTTIFPLEDFTRKIGGDLVEVKSVYPPNVDAHSYEPSTKTMTEIANSDLFIYSGAGIEGFADKAAETLKNEKVKIIKAAQGIDLIESNHGHKHDKDGHEHDEDDHKHDEDAHEHDEDGHEHDEDAHEHDEDGHEHDEDGHEHDEDGHEHDEDGHEHDEDGHEHDEDGHEHDEDGHEHDEDGHEHDEDGHEHNHGDHDPHVWLDPIRSIKLAANIKDALAELLPEHKDQLEENFNKLKEDLEALDTKFSDTINNADSKYLLVSHAAYGYWQERYGIKQIAISGLSPTQEPSQKQLQNIIEESKEHDIHYVIFEQNVSTKVAEIIQKEIGAESLILHNLESISEENIKQNDDYFSIMTKNLETIEKALNH